MQYIEHRKCDVGTDESEHTQDERFMRRAIELAKAGEGWVHPNPLVGAVIVKDGQIIGEGYHRKYGQLHAERNALADAREKAGESAKELLEGATMYVTLEPCCHQGKTPPCTEAILEHRIGRVVIGSRDPNPLVAGQGARILRQAGVRVEEDFLREECDAFNPVFFHYITTKTPYVIMKYAMTADGKIATKIGASKWITGEAARMEVQRIRHACMGIMVGIGTVLADDPLLNCRSLEMRAPMGRDTGSDVEIQGTVEGADSGDTIPPRHPIRIICDSKLRIPLDAQICRTAKDYETIVACASPALPAGELTGDEAPTKELAGGESGNAIGNTAEGMAALLERVCHLRACGITVLNVPGERCGDTATAYVDLKQLMVLLGARGIDSILLEGGGALNESALQAGIVSEVRAFVAPKIFGGQAKSPVEGTGVALPEESIPLRLVDVQQIGEDLMLRYQAGSTAEPPNDAAVSPDKNESEEPKGAPGLLNEKKNGASQFVPNSPDVSTEGR